MTPADRDELRRTALLCAGTLALLVCAFPPVGVNAVTCVALAPWLVAIGRRESARLYRLSFALGAVFYLWSLAWIAPITAVGYVLLCLYLAGYFVAFAAAARAARRQLGIPLAFAAPVIWVALEYARSNLFTGFPWVLLGHAMADRLPSIQVASATGAYGVSFNMALVASVAATLLVRWQEGKRPLASSGLAALVWLVVLMMLQHYCVVQTAALTPEPQRGPVTCVVQANIPQSVKVEQDEVYDEMTLTVHSSMTRENAGKAELFIWPETMLPGFFNVKKDLQAELLTLSKDVGAPLLAGGVSVMIRAPDGRVLEADDYDPVQLIEDYDSGKLEFPQLNSAYLVDGEAGRIERYDKLHLVPFGEYIPLRKLLFFAGPIIPYEEGFRPGSEMKIFEHGGRRFAALICFEDTFPGLCRAFVNAGAEFLVNISNDGWFGGSWELDQHLAACVFRAVENGVGIVRATNTGISCLIEPNGEVTQLVRQGGSVKEVRGVSISRPALAGRPTFYRRHGDLFAVACAALSGGIVLASLGAWLVRRRRTV